MAQLSDLERKRLQVYFFFVLTCQELQRILKTIHALKFFAQCSQV